MMILCIHLMDSHDFDIMEWCYNEEGIIALLVGDIIFIVGF